jgi:hypothetical protein
MPAKEEARSAPAPKSAEVANWPYPQYSQKADEQHTAADDIAKTNHVD